MQFNSCTNSRADFSRYKFLGELPSWTMSKLWLFLVTLGCCWMTTTNWIVILTDEKVQRPAIVILAGDIYRYHGEEGEVFRWHFSKKQMRLLHFVFGILSLQDPRHFVYGSDSFESQLQREITDMNHSLSTSRTLLLYNRGSNQHLRILPGRKVDARGEEEDEYARLIVTSERFDGVTIQGQTTGYYLCVNKKGQMIGRKRLKTGGSVTCVFTELINEFDWTEFRPVQKTNWFLGFNRAGESKRTDRCRPGSRSVQFMKRPLPETLEEEETNEDLKKFIDLLVNLNKLPARGNS